MFNKYFFNNYILARGVEAIDTDVFLKNLEPHISNIMSEGEQRLSLENMHGRFNKAMDALNASSELLR
jgi:hypothetical protein